MQLLWLETVVSESVNSPSKRNPLNPLNPLISTNRSNAIHSFWQMRAWTVFETLKPITKPKPSHIANVWPAWKILLYFKYQQSVWSSCRESDTIFVAFSASVSPHSHPQTRGKQQTSRFQDFNDFERLQKTSLHVTSLFWKISKDFNPFTPGVPYMGRLEFLLYIYINMTSSTILYKCSKSSIYYKNRKSNSDDNFTVNMCFVHKSFLHYYRIEVNSSHTHISFIFSFVLFTRTVLHSSFSSVSLFERGDFAFLVLFFTMMMRDLFLLLSRRFSVLPYFWIYIYIYRGVQK